MKRLINRLRIQDGDLLILGTKTYSKNEITNVSMEF